MSQTSVPSTLSSYIHEQPKNAVPVMRRDLSMIRRTEEGYGESLSLSVFGSSYPQHNGQLTNKGEREASINPDKPPDIQPSSSLPSPPASSPTSISPLPPSKSPDHIPHSPKPGSGSDVSESETSGTGLRSAHRTDATSSRHATPLIRHVSPATPPPRQTRFEESTPSFAALSSPADSPLIPPVPPTPSFNSQVESATRKRKRGDETPPKTPPRTKLPFRHSFNSHSSARSQDSVEKHLTQSMDIYDGDCGTNLGDQAASDARHDQGLPLVGGIQGADTTNLQGKEGSHIGVPQPNRSQIQMETHLQPTTLPRYQQSRQAWYGTRPPITSTVKQRKNASATSSRTSSGAKLSHSLHPLHPQAPTSGQSKRPWPTSPNVYRSGILEITPSATEANCNETRDEVQDEPSSQSQESSLEYLSYPLQTQAPYESQSFSQ